MMVLLLYVDLSAAIGDVACCTYVCATTLTVSFEVGYSLLPKSFRNVCASEATHIFWPHYFDKYVTHRQPITVSYGL